MASARPRVRAALLAAESGGTLRPMVAEARQQASGRSTWQRCETARPRWQVGLVILQAVVLLALFVGLVFAAAYALGRCTAAEPWQSDDAAALRRCAAASCLGLLPPLLCAWTTTDRHCRRRTPITAAVHPSAVSPAAAASPNPEDLLVDYIRQRPRQLPKQLPPLRLGPPSQRAKQQELLPLPTKQDTKSESGKYRTVSLKALIGMIQAGSLDPHTQVRSAAVRSNQQSEVSSQSPVACEL